MTKRLIVLICGVIGAFLLHDWWGAHHHVFQASTEWNRWAFVFGFSAFPCAMLVQIERTKRLLGCQRRSSITQPILLAHGMNVLLPSMLGDLYEIGALSRPSGLPKHAILIRLIHRFATTLSALLILAGFAMSVRYPSMGFLCILPALLGPLLLDAYTSSWSVRIKIPGTEPPPAMNSLGGWCTLHHIGLALLQHIISAVGIFFLGIAVGEAISPAVAAAMLSLADLLTYAPIPIAGLGVHHWTIISAAEWLGSAPVTLVAINHGWVVLSAIICIGLANWYFDRAK